MRIGIVGGGIGGLSLANGLLRAGVEVAVFEKVKDFGQVGADINLTPNSSGALKRLGVFDEVAETAARPTRRLSREWATGVVTSDLPMGDEAEKKYGAPQLTVHRAALMSALYDALPAGTVRFDHQVASFADDGARVVVSFVDGGTEEVDALVGADGIHSMVRSALFGPQEVEYTGMVAYRAVVPAGRLAGVPNLDAFTKWWGPDPMTQMVTFPLNRGEDVFVFATVAEPEWNRESWTMPGNVEDFRHLYRDFHPDARALIDACDDVMKSALCVRTPMPAWGAGLVTLLGDACHPMTPFMAQGAGQAIEDAVVLTRALTEPREGVDLAARLRAYEDTRRGRTSRIQLASRGNEWLRQGGDADWLYGHDVWSEEIQWSVGVRSSSPEPDASRIHR